MDDEFVLQNLTIGFKHFPHMKSGHNLRQFVKCFLIQAGVKPQQVNTVFTQASLLLISTLTSMSD